jgi:REP element-mobilizing transposase RayT
MRPAPLWYESGAQRFRMKVDAPTPALAVHWITTTFGTWLHGDPRGSWINGKLCGPDPFLEAFIEKRLSRKSVVLSGSEMDAVSEVIGRVVEEQRLTALAATVHPTHVHLILAPPKIPIKTVIATLKYRTSCEVLATRRAAGRPVGRSLWTEGQFPVFIFNERHLENAVEYVREHNRRVDRDSDPYWWLYCNVLRKTQDGQGNGI